jgi:hypothetical protein
MQREQTNPLAVQKDAAPIPHAVTKPPKAATTKNTEGV